MPKNILNKLTNSTVLFPHSYFIIEFLLVIVTLLAELL